MLRGKVHDMIPALALMVDEVSIDAGIDGSVLVLVIMLERHISRAHDSLQDRQQ